MSINSKLIQFIGSHRFLNRKLRDFLPVTASLPISTNFTLYFDPKDLYGPSYYVMNAGSGGFYHYEEDLKSEVVQQLKKDSVFFDVGANIGLISFFVKRFFPDVAIYAFEPGRTMSTCLQKTIETNQVSKMSLIKKGVADKSGTAQFFIDPKSTGGSSIARQHKDKKNRNIETIELISLDDFVAESKVIPDLIKVDVEGAENRVVAGAVNLIKNHSPSFIIEADHQNILDELQLWQSAFADYSWRPIASAEFFPIEKLGSEIKARLDSGKKGYDYLFMANSKL